jgi:hypothetical protein
VLVLAARSESLKKLIMAIPVERGSRNHAEKIVDQLTQLRSSNSKAPHVQGVSRQLSATAQ